MVHTAQLDKNMPSRSLTRVTSSATTSSTPLSPKKIPSSALALAIRASCVYIGLSKMIGVFVSPHFLLPSPCQMVAGHRDRAPLATAEDFPSRPSWPRATSVDARYPHPPCVP